MILVMSRRSIFMLAAAVVFLYFSVIVFMLNPLHGSKSVYYGNGYMHHFGFRQLPSVHWCKVLRYRSPPSNHLVALVSYPGSGNTWLRYLLQQATGIVTGSVYMDYGLRIHGFPAENVTDGTVLVIKTHEAPPIEPDKFSSAVLLIRNPRDAILADFNRLHKGHVGTAPKSAFTRKSHENKKSEWSAYVSTQLTAWETLHRVWLTQFPGTMHIVFYESLVRDLEPTLRRILDFLHYNITDDDMKCTLNSREGIYRRRKKHDDFDPFTWDMYKDLDTVKNRVIDLVLEYRKLHNESNTENV